MSEKDKLYRFCVENIQSRIESLKKDLDEIQASANKDTKSSMGDKYETSRAMAMLEKERISTQLQTFLQQKKVMDELGMSRESRIGLGSLVITSNARIFISVGLGKVEMNEYEYLIISAVSPLGKAIMGLTKGDHYRFQNRDTQILEVF